MNTSALIMMIFSIVLLWGGLVLAVIHLAKIRKNQKTKNLDINLHLQATEVIIIFDDNDFLMADALT